MEETQILMQAVLFLVPQIPVLIACAVGGVLALKSWRRDPHRCLLIMLSCLLFFCVTVFFSVLYIVLPQYFRGLSGGSMSAVGPVYMVMSIAKSFLTALAWALLLAAAFRHSPAA